jgi:quinol monooxygenase YgiN
MFAITATMTWDPSDRDDLMKTLVPLCEASREEDGNVGYWWAEDVSRPGTFHVFEHWGSEEAFSRHCQSSHYLAFMEACMPRVKEVSATRHEIAESRSLTG